MIQKDKSTNFIFLCKTYLIEQRYLSLLALEYSFYFDFESHTSARLVITKNKLFSSLFARSCEKVKIDRYNHFRIVFQHLSYTRY